MDLRLQLLGSWVVNLEALEVFAKIDSVVVIKMALFNVEGVVLVHVAKVLDLYVL